MTKQKVPETKVESPKVISLTKTQRELFLTDRNEITRLVGQLNQFMINRILASRVDQFIEELKINIQDEDWDFDAEKLRFTRRERKS